MCSIAIVPTCIRGFFFHMALSRGHYDFSNAKVVNWCDYSDGLQPCQVGLDDKRTYALNCTNAKAPPPNYINTLLLPPLFIPPLHCRSFIRVLNRLCKPQGQVQLYRRTLFRDESWHTDGHREWAQGRSGRSDTIDRTKNRYVLPKMRSHTNFNVGHLTSYN